MEAAELLRSYALSRGWVAASGLPDETRSGRQILKDFVNGKLLHCERPPACALNNTQLGLTGQPATASKHAVQTQAGLSGTAAAEADQSEAQLNGDSHSLSDGASGSASEPDESSDQGANGAESSHEESASADDAAAVSSSSDTEAAAHSARLNDADRELMESMSNVQGRHGSCNVTVGAAVATPCSIPPMLFAHSSMPGGFFSARCSEATTAVRILLDVLLSAVSYMQLLTANLRDPSTSFKRSQLALKATAAKLMMAVQSMMVKPSQQADVAA